MSEQLALETMHAAFDLELVLRGSNIAPVVPEPVPEYSRLARWLRQLRKMEGELLGAHEEGTER